MYYNWIDRYLLNAFRSGQIKATRWVSLGDAWRSAKSVANIAIVRKDGKVLYERGL